MSRAVSNPPQPDCEFIVVGSGAGGGTVAARLAEEGKRVILLEAGGDPRPDAEWNAPDRLPLDYDVPAFHGFASEHPALAWNFFVRHYQDDARQRRDQKLTTDPRSHEEGIFYPRAGTLGGCTAHNAMIFVCPHNADWDAIAKLTGDSSWSSVNMWRYFERVEDCRHRPLHRWLSKLGINLTRHGWNGWLPTEKAIPKAALDDRQLFRVILKSAREAFREDGEPVDRIRWFLEGWLDPNDWRLVRDNAVGARYLPLTTERHARKGARDRIVDVASRFPNRLRIVLNALATRVVFDSDKRAIGVEYLQGKRLYRAHTAPNPHPGERRTVYASEEVILAGGTFNSPQLLMLSGVGPGDVLRRMNIEPLVVLPGVGRNLQDRYEIGVVNRMKMDAWQVYEGATFRADDPQFAQWSARRKGVYSTNGSVLTVFRRSAPDVPLPDLFCMALLANFSGYYPGYSSVFSKDLNALTWVVLKAHTGNRAGTVTLRSADPLEPPSIDFRFFDEQGDADLKAMVEGVRFVRRIARPLRERGLIVREEVPGDQVVAENELADFVRFNAWGHHACGTCAIGSPADNGVLTSDFRVHHTKNLRVVDASIFPRIPGFFIASAVYMIGEKAADVILSEIR
jgi:choline dehydrogenase-like flavoprotein